MVSKIESVLLTIFIFFCIGFSVIQLEVSPHIPILFGIVLLLAFGFLKRISWSTMEKGMISSISAGIPSIFIFLLVGVLISVWIAAGTIPTFNGIRLPTCISKNFRSNCFCCLCNCWNEYR